MSTISPVDWDQLVTESQGWEEGRLAPAGLERLSPCGGKPPFPTLRFLFLTTSDMGILLLTVLKQMSTYGRDLHRLITLCSWLAMFALSGLRMSYCFLADSLSSTAT